MGWRLPVKGVLRRVIDRASTRADDVKRLDQRRRRAAFLARTRAAAAWQHAVVEMDIAPDVRVGDDVRVQFQPWSQNVLRIGPGGLLDDRVRIQLKGGAVLLGPRVEIRRDCVLNIAGRLEVVGDTPISWNSVIHCSSSIRLESMVGLAEQVTLADSSHYFTDPDAHFWHNVRTGEITVGRNTWLCPKVTVTRGAHIGSHCIVGSNSVVVGVVPDGSLASGIPATARPLPLPWAKARRQALDA